MIAILTSKQTGGFSSGWVGGSQGKYQADGNAAELNDVGVGNRIEPTDPCVKNSDQRRYDHGRVEGNLEDDSKGCAWSFPSSAPKHILTWLSW